MKEIIAYPGEHKNKEAIYFNNPSECVKKCKNLLNNSKLRYKISKSGHNKITKVLRPEAERIFKKILKPSYLNKNINKFLYKF